MTIRRSLLGLLTAALAAAGCHSGGSSSDESPPPPRPIAAGTLAGHLRVLDLIARQNGGDRAAGTQGYAGSVAYVAGVLRRLGWRVRVQQVPMATWRERSSASHNPLTTTAPQTIRKVW